MRRKEHVRTKGGRVGRKKERENSVTLGHNISTSLEEHSCQDQYTLLESVSIFHFILLLKTMSRFPSGVLNVQGEQIKRVCWILFFFKWSVFIKSEQWFMTLIMLSYINGL